MNKFITLIALLVGALCPLLPSYSAESDTYNFSWLDPDKEVYVLQNRKYRKSGRLHAYVGGGKTLSGAFVDSTTLQGRVGYFFREAWGVEFLYAMNDGQENDTAELLRTNGGARPFRRIIDNYMGGMLLWSPFYSKINTFNKILYFDWFIGLGFAKVEETNNAVEFQTNNLQADPQKENHTALMWDIGMKFFVNNTWSLRLDLTTLHYQAESPEANNSEKLWYENFDLAFMLGYNF